MGINCRKTTPSNKKRKRKIRFSNGKGKTIVIDLFKHCKTIRNRTQINNHRNSIGKSALFSDISKKVNYSNWGTPLEKLLQLSEVGDLKTKGNAIKHPINLFSCGK
jgi:hypothetical protein